MQSITLSESPSAVRRVTGDCWQEIAIFARELSKDNRGFIPDIEQTKMMKILPAAQFLLAHTKAGLDSPIKSLDPAEYPLAVANIFSSIPSWKNEVSAHINSIDTVLLVKRLFLALFTLNPKITYEKTSGKNGMKVLTNYSITLRDPLVTVGEITRNLSPESLIADANIRIRKHGIIRLELLAGEINNNN